MEKYTIQYGLLVEKFDLVIETKISFRKIMTVELRSEG